MSCFLPHFLFSAHRVIVFGFCKWVIFGAAIERHIFLTGVKNNTLNVGYQELSVPGSWVTAVWFQWWTQRKKQTFNYIKMMIMYSHKHTQPGPSFCIDHLNTWSMTLISITFMALDDGWWTTSNMPEKWHFHPSCTCLSASLWYLDDSLWAEQQ